MCVAWVLIGLGGFDGKLVMMVRCWVCLQAAIGFMGMATEWLADVYDDESGESW